MTNWIATARKDLNRIFIAFTIIAIFAVGFLFAQAVTGTPNADASPVSYTTDTVSVMLSGSGSVGNAAR